MKKPAYLLLAFIFLATASYTQVNPNIEKITEVFFSTYDYPSQAHRLLRFESRPDGYYVARINASNEVERREKFYDNKSKTYLTINSANEWITNINGSPTNTKNLSQSYLLQLGLFEKDAFNRQPYYGYPGWYKHAIAYWENKEKLTNEELHALARAYSTAAISLLANYSNYSLDEERFLLKDGIPAMNTTQLQQYLQATNKCLTAYKTLKDRDPQFTTPLGPASTKYANERMNVFLTLLYFQGEEEARHLLERDMYEPYFLSNARNYLRSCPKDAVVVAWGDTDTYTLLYVQATEGFRTDVIVINTSLLAVDRYRKMLVAGPLNASPLQTDLPDFYNISPIKVWINSLEYPDSSITYALLKEKISREDNYYKSGNTWSYPLAYSYVAIPVPPSTPYLYENNENTIVRWRAFTSGGYELINSYALLDLLAANELKRSLCFLPTVTINELRPWQEHLTWNGWVYQIVSDRMEDNRIAAGIMHHTDSTFNLWQKKMVYDTTTIITSFDKLPFYQHQIKSARELLTRLLKDKKTDEAYQFARSLPQNYPNTIRSWDRQWIELVPLFRQSGALETANKILETIAENVRENRIDFQREEDRYLLLQRIRELKW